MLISVTVFRFEYLDRATNALRVSPDFATEAAIEAMGGTLIPESAREVPAGEVTFSGIWRPTPQARP